MSQFDQLASDESVQKSLDNLKRNGIETIVVSSGDEAVKKVLELIPEGAELLTMTSITLESLGLTERINASGKYEPVRKKLMSMDRATQGREMQKLGAAPEYALGSVNAVTEEGEVLVASNTGSQLPAYSYGAAHVIWVVGIQKIVKDRIEGIKRIYDYVLPLESERAKKAYGTAGSHVSKLLIINREVNPGRLTLIFVKEKLGF